MSEYFKNSFTILVKNPHLVLLLVIYLIISINLTPYMAYHAHNESSVFYLLAGLFILLTVVFFSGWLGIIKTIVERKNTNDDEFIV